MATSLALKKLLISKLNPINSQRGIRPVNSLFQDVFERFSSARISNHLVSSMQVNVPQIGKDHVQVQWVSDSNRIDLPKYIYRSDGIMGEMKNAVQMFRPRFVGLNGIRVPVVGITLLANRHMMACSLNARSWAHTTTKSGKPLKYNKYRKGRCSRRIKADGTQVSFGRYGIKSCEAGRISSRAIEAARRAIIGHFKRKGKLWIRVLADLPVTKKPTEVRMGRGKGNVAGWVARVSMGQILFEMDGVSLSDAQQAATLATHKLSISTKFITWS